MNALIGRRPDPGRCPQCEERVTPFAAGCALCGADLDPRRWDAGPSAGQRAGSWVSTVRMGSSAGPPRRAPSPPLAEATLSWVVAALLAAAVIAVIYACVA